MGSFPARRAFTLLELLLAVSLGAAVVAIAALAMQHVRKTAARMRSLTGNAQAAEGIIRVLEKSIGSMHPSCLCYLKADAGSDGITGTQDDVLTLTWMESMPSRWDVAMCLAQDYRTAFSWCRLEWSIDQATGLGRLRFARNSPKRLAAGPDGNNTLEVCVQPRRDHRRPMNDNALALIPGATASDLTAYAWLGDDSDLDANLIPMHADDISIESFTLRWNRRNGDLVTLRLSDGITCTDANGSGKSLPFGTFSPGMLYAVDGHFTDGSDPLIFGRTTRISDERPVRIELLMTVADSPNHAPGREVVRSEFWTCIPIDPVGASHVQ